VGCLGLRWPPFAINTTINGYSASMLEGAMEERQGRVRTCEEDILPLYGAANGATTKIERGKLRQPLVAAI
jgi:hypothetical protein